MKKIFLLLFFAIILSSCASGNNESSFYNEKSISSQASTYDETEVMKQIINLRNGAKPLLKPTGESKPIVEANQAPTPVASQAARESPQPMQSADLAKEYKYAIIKTNFGDIELGFYATESPITVNNFLNLAKMGFYDKTKFHRVIKDFMIQGGDSLSKDDNWADDGTGGPGYQFQDEINSYKLVRDSLAMANSGSNTNGSQFFIVTATSTPWLDGKHTNFGYVMAGMDVVDKIENLPVNENSHPKQDAIINSIELVK